MKPQIGPLTQCGNCSRHGWHTTEKCPEIPAIPIPPTETALLLDGAVNMIALARGDGNKVLRSLPRDTPLFAVVDLVTALGHLRQAAVLIDRAADQLEVQR